MPPRLIAGASGYSHKEWQGTFYPEKIRPDAMLAFYAERLPTVEINNTFYQMPKPAVLEAWSVATPETFRFAIKASRRITHDARLKAEDAADSVAFLYRNLATLGDKRGPVLFQLPPFLKKDLPRLEGFLALLPDDHRAAFEFRNESWFDDDVYAALRRAGASLCLSERSDDQKKAHADEEPAEVDGGLRRLACGEPDVAQRQLVHRRLQRLEQAHREAGLAFAAGGDAEGGVGSPAR